uniref:exodeoxyribonuclease V subunit gamma n=1 Tax=Stomatohabitans albus TaxID=3110766 RepID=UPI00300D1CFC
MLHLTVSPTLDQAVRDLANHMPPGETANVLQPWHIVVPGSSAQRIVSQRLSHALGATHAAVPSGVSANVVLELPYWLSDVFLAEPQSHQDRAPDPWAIDRMAWTLMALPADPGVHRWRLARRIADDIDRSQLWRPDVVLDWIRAYPDPAEVHPAILTHRLADMAAFLRARTQVPTLVERAHQLINEGMENLVLPGISKVRPLMLFGVHSLSALQLSLLTAYAKHHDVYWWITTPLMAIARQMLERDLAFTSVSYDASNTFIVRDTRSALAITDIAKTPLNQANARATIEGLNGVACVAARNETTLRILDDAPVTTTVLGKVQQAIRTDTQGEPVADTTSDESPASLVRVACARPQRQVEALRDYLLNCFMDDPSLQPRDVVVACPDPHRWEAAIRRAFAPGTNRPYLRVRLVDPYAKLPNPVRDVIEYILSLVEGQLTRLQLLDLLAMGPVAAKFGFDEQDIDDLGAYLEATHMTWGLNPQDRERFGLPVYHGGTLQDSREQLALGLARLDGGMDDLPALGIKPGHVDLIGRFFTATDVLGRVLEQARQPQSVVEGWVPLLQQIVEQCCWVDFDHGWQVTSVLRDVNRLSELAAESEAAIPVWEFLEIVQQMARSGGRRGDIAAGDLIVTSLSNARGLTHRVVCLLGMDEGQVPRPRTRVSVDEWGEERVGDRDAASSDRQAWLDLLAGQAERVAIFWSAPPQGGEAHPSVMVTDLNRTLEALGANRLPSIRTRRAALHRWSVLDHYEQPSPDRRASELAAIHFESQRTIADPDRLGALAVDDPILPDVVSVTDLIRFGQDPLHAYARHTLGIGWLGNEQEPEDVVIKASSGGLGGWAVHDEALRTNQSAEVITQRAIRSGVLPIRPLAGDIERDIEHTVEQVAQVKHAQGLTSAEPIVVS